MTSNKLQLVLFKNPISLSWLMLVFLFFSCTPTIQYLGDSYQETNRIDVFYDAKDVDKAYQTIGQMSHDKFLNYEVEEVKKSMIRKAKEKGGDGIIFTSMTTEREGNLDEDRLSITAKVIKYKDRL